MRKMFVSQMLSKTNLDDCYAMRKEEMHKSISQIYHDKIGTPTDLAQFAFSTSINTTMRMLWGTTLQGENGGDFGEEYRKVAAELMDILAKPNISDYFPALARLRQAKKIQSKIDKILTCAI
ncbi:PREDICTED: tabersonine 16-hydroxylase-like [Fragaria vesca subsp. vesca]|uniref:tabersonine 16-hydroxylase-like n=1 Tax=Fragaria vesca subsp. vesca TaxID=101020 RepID=UPI0002C33C1F|nr:PREDICTED: tabersonine 16-hydroxylase-like [Fragaria vesca subsp. vesca]